MTGTITIPKDAYYDSKNLYVETKTYDKAGNKTECSQTIKFDTTHPTAGISFDKEMKTALVTRVALRVQSISTIEM